jgi:hypothetical protein
MASEDSDELVPGLLPVHRLRDLGDLDETVEVEVTAGIDQLDAARELLEVLVLRAPHRILPEERDDRLQQVDAAPDDVSVQVLAVVVIPLVREDLPDAEELTKVVETGHALLALRHREFMSNLETGPVAASAPPAWLPDEPDRESRSILLRLQNRSPNHGTRSAFPAGFPHPTRCHHGKRPAGRHEVVRDTRVFQHLARCAPHRYRCGGQRNA